MKNSKDEQVSAECSSAKRLHTEWSVLVQASNTGLSWLSGQFTKLYSEGGVFELPSTRVQWSLMQFLQAEGVLVSHMNDKRLKMKNKDKKNSPATFMTKNSCMGFVTAVRNV